MLVNEYKAFHNLTDRQWRTLKDKFEKTYPSMDITIRTGSKSFDIIENVKPLLDKLLPPKRNASENATNNVKNIEVLTGEVVDYEYTSQHSEHAIVYGNSNVKANHSNLARLNDTLTLSDELFERIDDAIDIHKSNLAKQESAVTDVNEALELKLMEVREKLLQVKKAELKAKTRIETGTDEAAKKHLELSALLSAFSSHLG